MFTHHCTECQKTQLISLTMATSFNKVADGGLHVNFTCWCGATQEHTLAALGAETMAAAV